MVEHLAKVAAIHPSTARRTSIKMLVFGQIAHARANVLPARKLNNRAVSFRHVIEAALLVPLGLSLLLLLLLYRTPLVLRCHTVMPPIGERGQKGFRSLTADARKSGSGNPLPSSGGNRKGDSASIR